MIRNALKSIPYVYKLLLKTKHKIWIKKTKAAVEEYLANNPEPKLQLGAGANTLESWFNTDYFPRDNIFFIDVTKPFPVNAGQFEYIFSEHHIEHISYKDATFMLKEVFRIMKPGGHIRINTPDLKKYINQYPNDNEQAQMVDAHIKKWIYSGFYNAVNFIPVDDYARAHFINDIFLNYDHKFIYDFESLKRQLTNAGFTNIIKCTPNISANNVFNDTEAHKTSFDHFFTLAIEAQKPAN